MGGGKIVKICLFAVVELGVGLKTFDLDYGLENTCNIHLKEALL